MQSDTLCEGAAADCFCTFPGVKLLAFFPDFFKTGGHEDFTET